MTVTGSSVETQVSAEAGATAGTQAMTFNDVSVFTVCEVQSSEITSS